MFQARESEFSLRWLSGGTAHLVCAPQRETLVAELVGWFKTKTGTVRSRIDCKKLDGSEISSVGNLIWTFIF